MSSLVSSAENYLMDHTSLRRCTNQWFIFFQVCLDKEISETHTENSGSFSERPQSEVGKRRFRRITAALANLEPSITLVEAQVPPPPFFHTIREDDFALRMSKGPAHISFVYKSLHPSPKYGPDCVQMGQVFTALPKFVMEAGAKRKKTPKKGTKMTQKRREKGGKRAGKKPVPSRKNPGK